jgi:tetratricopeptide (TPR) repeat protein
MKPKHPYSPPADSIPATRARRGLAIALVLMLASLLVAGAVWADWYYGIPANAQASFVGRSKCLDCHQSQHAAWTGSHHDLAMDLATEKTVLADFNNATLEHHGQTSRMFKKDGKFWINTEGPDGQFTDFEVKYVFGVEPLQQYMVEFDRPAGMPASEIARVQVLRVSWDTYKKRWFHLDPPDVPSRLSPDDDLHWTGIAQRWNNMCADCHSTNLQKNFDVPTLTYHTTFSEIDVSCEACHGPGSLHVQLATAPSLFWDRKRGYALAKLRDASNVNEVQACAHCHSRRRVVTTNYTAGCNYYDYFSNELLTQTSYHADGQILDEVYEFGSFVQSKMYHKNVRCTDCHDPHTARLKHQGNQVCTSCHQHPAGKYDGENHHRHKQGGAGSKCVDCHMPQTTYMMVDPRRDHSFRIPRPDLSVQLGTPNACTGCHLKEGTADGRARLPPSRAAELKGKEYADWLRAARTDESVREHLTKLDRWADETLDKWYGKDRKRPPHFAATLHAARTQAPDARNKLLELLADKEQPAIARATASQELATFAGSDAPVTHDLLAALADRDPQPRIAAVASLQPTTNETLLVLAGKSLTDNTRAVRAEAGRVLARLPELDFRGQERKDWKAAIDEAFAAADVDNDRAGGHLMRGVLFESLQEEAKAEEAYRTAIRVEPGAVGPRANLAALLDRRLERTLAEARQLATSGNLEAAKELLAGAGPLEDEAYVLLEGELALVERDVQFLPESAGLQARLGFLRHSQGWRKEAERAITAAHRLEPQTPDYAHSLAVLYFSTGRYREALALATNLRKLRPQEQAYEQLEADIRKELRAGPAP